MLHSTDALPSTLPVQPRYVPGVVRQQYPSRAATGATLATGSPRHIDGSSPRGTNAPAPASSLVKG